MEKVSASKTENKITIYYKKLPLYISYSLDKQEIIYF